MDKLDLAAHLLPRIHIYITHHVFISQSMQKHQHMIYFLIFGKLRKLMYAYSKTENDHKL